MTRTPLKRSPLARRTALARGQVKIKRTNAYHRKEWRALVREVRKRSGGICEAQVRCGGDPVSGDPHHKSYAPFASWRRLIVPLDQLVDCCRACHLSFHQSE